jgi:hypothetical protein
VTAPIPGVGPQLARAADGTDPRGVLVFEYLPSDLQNAEDSTQAADFTRSRLGAGGGWYREISKRNDTIAARDDAQAAGAPRLRWLSWLAFLRDATPAERELLAHLGRDVPEGLLYTRVSFPSPGVRNRRWPQLETL